VYKVASEKAQNKAERITIRDMPSTEENLGREYRLEMLREELRKVDAAIIETHPKSHERKTLGARKRILADEVRSLRGETKKYPGISVVFWEVARRMLPKETFNQLHEEAEHIYEIRYGKKP
jgi:hypothetical protein